MQPTHTLKSLIEQNNTVLALLEKEGASIGPVLEEREKKRQEAFKKFLTAELGIVPANIVIHNFRPHISYSNVTLRWDRYEKDGYSSDISIYVTGHSYRDKNDPSKLKFEICFSSSKAIVFGDPEKQASAKADNEVLDANLLSMNFTHELMKRGKLFHFIVNQMDECCEDSTAADKIWSARDKYKRENDVFEREIELNVFRQLVKVGALIDSVGWYDTGKGRRRRRHGSSYDQIEIVKETKKNYILNFSKNYEYVTGYNEDGTKKDVTYRRSNVIENKRFTRDEIISLLHSNDISEKKRVKDEEARKEREAKRQAERQAEIEAATKETKPLKEI